MVCIEVITGLNQVVFWNDLAIAAFLTFAARLVDIYAPMIYTARCLMFLMRADTLRGQVVGCWALKSSFLGPVKWHRADRRVPFLA
jgi:hypothetical protein